MKTKTEITTPNEANTGFLVVEGANENNLKDLNVRIPHRAITVITGVSGSGKSTLAYDVIFKESQRRFMESFSSYSRLFLGKMEKPAVKKISGLQAALAVQQHGGGASPRSTVGTMSGVYDYLRLLYARTGKRICFACGMALSDSTAHLCPHCGHEQPKMQSALFSFNSKHGACDHCNGLGVTEQIDIEKLIADPALSLRQGALVPTTPNGYIVYSQVRVDELDKVCRAHGFSVDVPWNQLTAEQQRVIMFGSDKIKILFGKHGLESRLKWKGITAKPREEAYYKGMIPIMEEILKRDRNDNILRFASSFRCPSCNGNRLRKEALSVFVDGMSIDQLTTMPLHKLEKRLQETDSKNTHDEVTTQILSGILNRLKLMRLLGLDYLTLSRESTTLSGGETQRIKLAAQVESRLQGVLYVMDEPSVGLHARDNSRLLSVLSMLRDNGNTVLVVEHDEQTIRAADYLIDIGPKAGLHGGELIYQGIASGLIDHPDDYPNSLTAKLLSQHDKDRLFKSPRSPLGSITIKNAAVNNLNHICADFKMGAFNVITGVSGAGKSTLMHEILGRILDPMEVQKQGFSVSLSDLVTRIIAIDQSPIGRTSRSNPATYTDLFDHIRDLFAALPESKKRGYPKGRFSFNNTGGRCETCQGSGTINLGMHFLGDVETRCESCDGKRFNEETLQITLNGLNIYQVLELSVDEAHLFFKDHPKITRILDQLIKLDVGYLKLGQPATTLSGGEAQRVKLASELYKTSAGHVLYLLDEPTVGLHDADIEMLLLALNEIVDQGNTVVVIEHDLKVIQQADHVIDLGPEGGDRGGQLIFQGTPENLMLCQDSFTGQCLKNDTNHVKTIAPSITNENQSQDIRFKGVNTNNLKNINVRIPLNRTTVITGVSGSGKSSLAFDTLFSESRNRFSESMSTYARRMMSKVRKPELEECTGLTPAIAIRQNKYAKNPRSTVGTVTEIYDYYRLLFSRFGKTDEGGKPHYPASMFSFNNPAGACATCKGLGVKTVADPKKFITHPEKPLTNGAMDGTAPGRFFGDGYGQYVNTLLQVGKELNIDFNLPAMSLDDEARTIALHGTGDRVFKVEWKFKRGNRSGVHSLSTTWKGMANYLLEEYELKKEGKRAEPYEALLSEVLCETCLGRRLSDNVLDTKIGGKNISELSEMSMHEAGLFLKNFLTQEDKHTQESLSPVLDWLQHKFNMLHDLGLGYLSANRATSTLSGGEAQRLRIAHQLDTDLCGLTYIFDEPTVGLHSRDTSRLMGLINKLKRNGNTVVLVEHDPDVIAMADHVIDLGKDAGSYGGEVIASGTPAEIKSNPNSVTGAFLLKTRAQKSPINRKLRDGLFIKKAQANNLKNIDLHIPAGGLIAITGVSGSGKTSLVSHVITPSFKAARPVNCETISFSAFNHLEVINQDPIGTNALSTPATYTGLMNLIREVMASLPEAKKLSLKKSHFSFNSPDGRCEQCKGMGQTKVSMDFLSDIWIPCESCHGQRFKEHVLQVSYRGKNISQVLQMEILSAGQLFSDVPSIATKIQALSDIGLGYLKLGQSTSTLSGGEIQRLKLAGALAVSENNNTLYIFDEPSTGLHMKDVQILINVFHDLINKGHTVLVIEHNNDIIQSSDWIIGLGPEGGDLGGEIIFNGPNTQ